MKRFGCLVGLLVLIFGGFVAVRTFFPARVGGAAFSELLPQTQKERRLEAQKLVERIEDVERDARQSEKKNFEISATENQLNTLLQDRLRTEKFPISDLRVGLSPGTLTLQGQVKYSGIEAPATLSGSLGAKNGVLVYNIESLSVSGLPAPKKLRDKAQNAIEDGLQKAFGREKRARVESVKIGDGKLVVSGTTLGTGS